MLLKSSLILLGLALLIACSQRQVVPDIEACVKQTRDKTFCKFTNSGVEAVNTIPDWSVFHQDRISVTIKDFSKIVEFIEKSCAISKNCDYENIDKLKNFLERTENESVYQ